MCAIIHDRGSPVNHLSGGPALYSGPVQILADNIRRLMDDRGYNPKTFEKVSGVSRSMMYYVLTGERSPTADTLLRIARGLRVPVWSLFLQTEQAEALTDPGAAHLMADYLACAAEGRALIRQVARAQVALSQQTTLAAPD